LERLYVPRSAGEHSFPRIVIEDHVERRRDSFRNLALKLEQLAGAAVVRARPNVEAVLGPNELRRDSKLVPN
jgi:hypothetical protein